MELVSCWSRGLALILLVALVGCDVEDPSLDRNPPNAIYVCNQAGATVSVIDPATNTVEQTIDLTEYGFSPNAKPHHVVVEPDGSAWYVSLIGEDVVAKFTIRNELDGTVPFEAPGMLSLHPDRERALLYAGHTMSLPDVPSTVGIIQRSDMRRVDIANVQIDRPHGMKVNPDGKIAYSSSLTANQIVAINTETNQVANPVSVPGSRQRYVQMDIAADGQTAYLTGQVAGQVQVLDLQAPATPRLVDSVDVGGEPWHPQLSDDGETLYAGSKATNTVYAVDTETLDTTVIDGEGLAQPHGTALSPDGQTLYVSNTNVNGAYKPPSGEDVGTVVAIDTRTNEITSVIEVGEEPAGINSRWTPQ